MDWTFRLTDLVILIVSLIGLPILWRLIHTLGDLRDTVTDLRRSVGGLDPPHGLLGDMATQRRELQRHRDWLIEIDHRHSQ